MAGEADEREKRRAAALKANLRRRKAQARAQAEAARGAVASVVAEDDAHSPPLPPGETPPR
jgi:hypothetical protein